LKSALCFDDLQRIESINKDCFINYPAAKNIRETASTIIYMSGRNPAPCMLIQGSSGMGKSALFKRIKSDSRTRANRLGIPDPLMSFSMASDPKLSYLDRKIAEFLHTDIKIFIDGEPSEAAIHLLETRRVGAMAIDEFHNLLLSNRSEVRKVLACLRFLTGPPLFLSIIALGIEDVQNAFRGDDQLKRRFQFINIPLWGESETLRSFLHSYEQRLPLQRPSNLSSKQSTRYLAAQSGGQLGIIVETLRRAAVYAILTGKERIDMECLHLAKNIPVTVFDTDEN
jgi:hypothetical protein